MTSLMSLKSFNIGDREEVNIQLKKKRKERKGQFAKEQEITLIFMADPAEQQ